MNLVDLDDTERLALVALVQAMVDADGEQSEEEMSEFREIAHEIGRAAFDEAFSTARARFPNREDAISFAEGAVSRLGAREIIHTVLVDLAGADGISAAEQALIDRVRAMWALR